MTKVPRSFIALALILALAGGACAREQPIGPAGELPAEPIKIGLVAPFSGVAASIGRNMREGVVLAVEDINNAGGVLGRRLEIVERDGDTTPKIGDIVREFVEKENVSLIIGPPSNAAYPAIEQYVREREVITMPIITSTALRERVNPYVFRIMIPDDIQVDLMVRYAVNTKRFRRLAVVATDDAGGRDFVELAEASLDGLGVRPATTIFFSPDALDLSDVALKVKQSGAEAIIFGSHIGPYAARLATANRNLGYTGPMLGFAGLTSYTYADLARDAAVGTVFVAVPIFSTVDRSQWSPRVADFYDKYVDRYFKDGTTSAVGADKVIGAAFLTYDGVQMWAKAATQAGSVEGEKVQPVLSNFSHGPEESVGSLAWSYTNDNHEGIHPGDMWFYEWVEEGSSIKFKFLGRAEELAK